MIHGLLHTNWKGLPPLNLFYPIVISNFVLVQFCQIFIQPMLKYFEEVYYTLSHVNIFTSDQPTFGNTLIAEHDNLQHHPNLMVD